MNGIAWALVVHAAGIAVLAGAGALAKSLPWRRMFFGMAASLGLVMVVSLALAGLAWVVML